MFVLTAMASCLGGWLLTQAVVDYQRVSRLQRAVDIDLLWFSAADKLAVERPLTGDILLGQLSADAATKARLIAVRQDADHAIDGIERQILALSYPGARHQLEIVRETREDLRRWRDKVSVMIFRPKSEREPHIFLHYVTALNALLERLDSALDLGDVAASQEDGVTMDLVLLSRQAWSLRRVVGARSVPLMAAVDDAVGLAPRQLERQGRFEGTIEAQWAAAEAQVLRLPDYPELPQALAAARGAFNEHDVMCQSILEAGREGAPYPVAAADIAKSVARATPALVTIRDVALAAARARARTNRRNAMIRVGGSATILVLIVLAASGTIRLLKRRIVSPVLALTEIIDLLARRNFDVEIPATAHDDEIGRMAIALATLREGAILAAANEAKISHMARHDALTGLPNRIFLHERIEQAVAHAARGRPCALLCLDLDRFKAVNDTFGHPTGDALLMAVSQRLLHCVREVDTVSRLGGDEFVVLLVALVDIDDSSVVAQRITIAMNTPFEIDGHEIMIGVSLGIAVAPLDASSAVELLKNADTALYRAKQEEKGSFRYFKPEMHAKLQARANLEKDLRAAIQSNALELFFQPQYVLTTDRLCGFEALLRWRHPVRGMISPGEFVPLAEETGLIVPIGAWVLHQACREAMGWPGSLTVSVNLSAVQFQSSAVVNSVREALEASGLPAARLDLEITETVLLDKSGATMGILSELHELGATIAMDDFGTGYSSLSYLRSFPFDTIKIDQSFVRDLAERDDARAIIRAIVGLGQSLGMKTLAEGVETQEQLAHLRREGCDEAQGYLFSKPIPASDARILAHRSIASWPALARG
jgi:diguanylate cyclase (GGDEF)-like protein